MKTMSEILEKVCERIDDVLKEKNWTIKQFAEYVGVPRTTVNSWLLRKRTPRIDLICQIADALGVTIDYLVGREEY